jgi:hypothetical protein
MERRHRRELGGGQGLIAKFHIPHVGLVTRELRYVAPQIVVTVEPCPHQRSRSRGRFTSLLYDAARIDGNVITFHKTGKIAQ